MISKFKKLFFIISIKRQYKNSSIHKEKMDSFDKKVYIDFSKYDPAIPAKIINDRINELYLLRKDTTQILYDTGLAKATFYRIISDFKFSNKPTKDNVIKLSIGLEFNLYQTLKLLNAYGYTFSDASHLDIIYEYFFKNWTYQNDERGTGDGVNSLIYLIEKAKDSKFFER